LHMDITDIPMDIWDDIDGVWAMLAATGCAA
jgi:hypothetical protein